MKGQLSLTNNIFILRCFYGDCQISMKEWRVNMKIYCQNDDKQPNLMAYSHMNIRSFQLELTS